MSARMPMLSWAPLHGPTGFLYVLLYVESVLLFVIFHTFIIVFLSRLIYQPLLSRRPAPLSNRLPR